MTKTRVGHRPVVGAVLLSALLAAGVVAQPQAAAAVAPCWGEVSTDLDGGGPDIVVGLPSYDLPGKPDAGAIVVYSNVAVRGADTPVAPAASRLITADQLPGLSSEAGARFGAAVVVAEDRDGLDDEDDCSDLLVGIPGQTVSGLAGAGQVVELKGSVEGLADVVETIDEDSFGIDDSAQTGAAFGAAIAYDRTVLAVGAPGRDASGVTDAGWIVRVDGFGTDAVAGPVILQQGDAPMGPQEAGDAFGEVLEFMRFAATSLLLVGIPHEDVGNRKDAGAVTMIPPSGLPSTVNQDKNGAGGVAEAGDRFGASLAGFWGFESAVGSVGLVAIGVPGEDVGRRVDAGAVAFAGFQGLPGAALTGRARVITQDSAHVAGSVEADDAFGAAVSVRIFDAEADQPALVVGAPREDVGDILDAGALGVTALARSGAPTVPPAADPVWNQDTAGVSGHAEAGDRFAADIGSVLLTRAANEEEYVDWQLIVAVPGEDVRGVANAGMAYVGSAATQVSLIPPVLQAGAGIGMVVMR